MKILHLLYESEGDYFGIGGVGIRAYEIYRCLKDSHDITLLCKKYPGAIDGEKKGLKHIFVGTESRSLTNTLLSYAFHAARFVGRHSDGFDLIIEEFSPAIPTFLHLFTKKPIVLQIQGYTGKLYFRKYNPVYAATLYAMELLRPGFYDNFIFANTETIKKFPLGKRKHTAVIPNGIASELLGVAHDESDYILYLGRIDIYGKGLDTLLDAYREFHNKFPDVELFIAGDGRDRQTFDNAIATLPWEIANRIKFLGWVSGDKKVEAIRGALFAVFPSRHEVQPIAALEIMACGKAVIVSDIPEFRFVVEKRAGISFETGNAASLANSMKNLMTNKERQDMGKRGRDWVKDYTWERIAKEYERFLEEIVER